MAELEFQKYQITRMLSVRRLSTAHFLPKVQDYETPVHHHNSWEFVFCEHGSVEVLDDTQWNTLHDGEIFFHGPNMSHCVRVGRGETTLFLMSFVCSSKMMKLLQGTLLKVNNEQKRRLRMIIQELYNAFELPNGKLLLGDFHSRGDAPLGSEQMVSSYLESLLINLLRTNTSRPGQISTPVSLEDALENHIAYELQAYIYEHLGEHITLESLARHFHYSRSYLTAQFRTTTGMSIMEYISQQRIERAKKLLMDGDMTVAQISELLGYSSIQYFSQCFKQAVGCSPSRYADSQNPFT